MPVSQLAWCQSVTQATFQPGSSWCGAQTAHHTDPSVLKEEGRERVADANARDRYCIHLLLIMQSFLCQQSSVPKLCLNTIVKTQMSKLLLVSFCTKPNSTDLHVGPVVVACGKEETRPHYQKKNGPCDIALPPNFPKLGRGVRTISWHIALIANLCYSLSPPILPCEMWKDCVWCAHLSSVCITCRVMSPASHIPRQSGTPLSYQFATHLPTLLKPVYTSLWCKWSPSINTLHIFCIFCSSEDI